MYIGIRVDVEPFSVVSTEILVIEVYTIGQNRYIQTAWLIQSFYTAIYKGLVFKFS